MSIDSVVRDAVRSLYHPAEKPNRFNSIERQEHAKACGTAVGRSSKSNSAQTRGSFKDQPQITGILTNMSYDVLSTSTQASRVRSGMSRDRTRTPTARPLPASPTTEEIDWAETSPVQSSSAVHDDTERQASA
jgi:hypothetical protein